MSFVTAQSPALMAAASKLQHLGTTMAAQNAAAAAPTTNVAPAAADSVSALQAMQFSAYGTWYQQVSQQATAIHQMLVNNLGSNAGSYGQTESANQASTGSTSMTGLLNALSGGSSSSGATGTAATSGSSNWESTIATPANWGQNWAAASSDMLDLAQGQYAPKPAGSATSALGLISAMAAPAPAPAAAGGMGAVPVSAGVGQASSIGKLSVPPGWAVGQVAPASPAPATVTGAGWTSAAPHGGHVNTVPGGVPSVASTQRGGYGAGAPRYGLKPTVMPKPTVV